MASAWLIATGQPHLSGHKKTTGLATFTVQTATKPKPETTMKMALNIMAMTANRKCATVLGNQISCRTSTRPSATKTCPLSMQRPGWLANGFGITVPQTRSTLFVGSESKKLTRMQPRFCLTPSMRVASAPILTHLRSTHILHRLQPAIYTTSKRPVTMVLRNSPLKVMQGFKAHASAKMLTCTSSKMSLHLFLEAMTKTVTQAP